MTLLNLKAAGLLQYDGAAARVAVLWPSALLTGHQSVTCPGGRRGIETDGRYAGLRMNSAFWRR